MGKPQNEIDKDYKKAKDIVKGFIVVALISAIFIGWWEWVKEKPIRFLYTALIWGVLVLLMRKNDAREHPDRYYQEFPYKERKDYIPF